MSSPFSCDKSQSSLVTETAGEGIYDNWASLGRPVFRQTRGVQSKPLLAFAVFQLPTAWNNPHWQSGMFWRILTYYRLTGVSFRGAYATTLHWPDNLLVFSCVLIAHKDILEFNCCHLIGSIYWAMTRARLSWITFKVLIPEVPSTMHPWLFKPLPEELRSIWVKWPPL